MKVLVALFTHNRPNLLRACTDFLLQDWPEDFSLLVLDDCSTDADTHEYLRPLRNAVRNPGTGDVESIVENIISVESTLPRGTYHDRAMRLALLRFRAMDLFLQKDQYDYLFFKDDDVLVSPLVIKEAIDDYEFLRSTDYAKIGALTLHGICSQRGHLSTRGKVFAELEITGEANVLFHKAVALKTGNHFAVVKGGFADTQFKAIRQVGYKYYDRVWPPYEVQHLGIGPNSSTIHQMERTPQWNRQLYRCTYRRHDSGELVKVDGFDCALFESLATRYGAERAVLEYSKQRHGVKDEKATAKAST